LFSRQARVISAFGTLRTYGGGPAEPPHPDRPPLSRHVERPASLYLDGASS